jgi:hypothetical protein
MCTLKFLRNNSLRFLQFNVAPEYKQETAVSNSRQLQADLGVEVRRHYDGSYRVWNGLTWLRIGTSGGLL